jgi:acetylornithine deacetylase
VTEAAAALLAELVSVDSTNPQLVPGAPGEAVVAELVAGRLRAAGLEVELPEVLPGRPNVVGTLRGSGEGPTLLLCSHLDVVGAEPGAFRPTIRDGRMHGRGTNDMKGGLAAAILAVECLAANPPRGDVVLAGCIDEEWASAGAGALAAAVAADAAILPETTGLDVVTTHGGFAWYEIESRGVEAAGDDPDHGRDAISFLGPVLSGLRSLDRRLDSRPHAPFGRPSVHASTIEGGQTLPSYPARCTLRVERCLVPGETLEQAEAEVAVLLDTGRAAEPDLQATLRTIVARAPVELSPDERIVGALVGAAERELGRAPVVRGDMGWMDSGILVEAGIPCVVFGPVGEGEHTADEWVDLASVEACARVLERTARAFCG